MSAIIDWFNSLLGKPKSLPTSIKAHETSKQVETAQTPAVSEDSVAGDLNSFKSLVGKVTNKVSEKALPVVTDAGVKSKSVLASVSGVMGAPIVKKIAKLGLIVIVLLVVLALGFNIFRNMGKGNGEKEEVDATPTSPPYEPEKLSIYAEDPVIIKLDEEVNVLEREFSGSSVKESTLNPPNLDFDVKF